MPEITIAKLQQYIAQKDFKHEYFLKLSEDVGELSRAMRKNSAASKSLFSISLSSIFRAFL